MKDSSNHEETLRKGSKPSGNAGLSAPGNKQAAHTPSKGMSDHESLRNSGRPAPESVKDAKHDPKAQKRAYNFNVRSENGGAEPTAHPCV